MTLEEQIELLPKRKTRERVRRLIAYRGSLAAFATSERIKLHSALQLVQRMTWGGGPLGDAIERGRLLRSGLTEADLIPCAACSLRGHVAGDPDRCSGLRTTGMGQWSGYAFPEGG